MTALLIAACLLLIVITITLWRRQIALRREAYIRNFTLPQGLFDKLRQRHPHLTLKECQLVAHGLRQFFLAHLKIRRQYVSMPSQAVDDLWHEFILYTRNCQAFCQKAFGRFFHHTPAVALGGARQSHAGLRRCWWQVCPRACRCCLRWMPSSTFQGGRYVVGVATDTQYSLRPQGRSFAPDSGASYAYSMRSTTLFHPQIGR